MACEVSIIESSWLRRAFSPLLEVKAPAFHPFARLAGLALGPAGLVLLLSALPASAQSVIAGTVRDAASGEPVGGGRILLLDSDEIPVGTTDTDDEGAFVISTRAGRYRIRVERLGYPTHTTESIRVAERDRVDIEVLLHAQAIGLDSLVIVGRRRETGREAFERRRDSAERGTFLDPIHVALAEAAMPSDLLRNVPDIEVSHRDQISHVLPRSCLAVFLDDMRLPIMGGSGMQVLGGNVHLNELVSARSVRAVEVYPTIRDVPQEIRQSRRWPAIMVDRCGVIIIWTTRAWWGPASD